jgi:hypothetical protein
MFGRIASVAGSVRPTRRGIVRGGLIAALAVVALLGAIMVAAPFYVEGEAAKAAIERQLAELTGGELRYSNLSFKVWPRPTAEVRQVTFRIAPVVEGTAERAVLRFALLPLLKGDLKVSRLTVDRPVAVVQIRAVDPIPVNDDPFAAYRSATAPTLAWLALHAGGLKLSIRDGSVALHHGGGVPLELDALTLDGEVSDEAVEAKITARGTLWKQARASLKVATASYATNLELAFDDLQADSALRALSGDSAVRMHPAAADATLSAQTDGQRSATAALSVSTPSLALARGGARVDLGAARARLKASYGPGESSLIVEELALGDWLSDASGSLKLTRNPGVTALEAKAGRVDASRVRSVLLAIVPEASHVGAVAAIVKGGNALDVRVVGLGDDLNALAHLAAYDVSMNVEKASFDVPVPPTELAGTSGKLRIAKSVLDARNVTATFGASKLSNGELILAIAPSVTLLSLSTAVDLDLAENRPRARYLSRETPLGAELDRLLSIAGRAAGTIKLRDVGGRLRESYDITKVNATLRHPGLPLPIAIDGGRFSFETGGPIVFRGVAGTIGVSRIEGVDADVMFAPAVLVRSASGTASLNMDELAPWILTLAPARALRSEVSALQGTVDMKLARISWAANAPERLEISAEIKPRRLGIATPHLPGRLTLDGGTLRLENADLLCDGVDAAVLDARGTFSGSIRSYATAARTLDLAIARATIGPRGLEWLENEASVGPGARLQAPLALDRARVRWPLPAPWLFEVTAAASFRNGGRAEVQLLSRPGHLNVRRLTLKDQESDARVIVDWQPDRAIVGYHGVVSARSISRMLAVPIAASGTLRGDFDATIDFREPARSQATGKLDGNDVVLPATFDMPVAIGRLSIDADGGRLRVRDTALRVGDESLLVSGSIARADRTLAVDATIASEEIDAERWLARLGGGAQDSGRSPPWWRSLAGRIALRARHLDLRGYRMEPFAASVVLSDDKLTAEVTEANLCGLAVPMTLTASGGTLELKGRATANDLPVAAAMACLSQGAASASGTMDVRADFSASGAPASLLASSRGSARLRARDGRIGGVHALSRVVEVDEVSQRLPKAEVESAREGLRFSALEIEAELAGRRVKIERALLESPALNVAMQGEIRLDDRQVALTGVALPIVNSILKSVPIIGSVVGDPVVGIPISVTGDISDPKVSRVAAGAIAGALVGTLQSVVSLPVQLLGGGASP